MLAIRLQRTGRKGNAQYRVIVQEAQRTPTSGRVVYRLGSFDPHAKTFAVDKEKAEFYLGHGAQPSDRVARLFKNNGVKLPDWVKISEPIKRTVRNPEKLRKNQPKVEKPANEPVEPTTETEAPAPEEVAETEVASAEPTEVVAEAPVEAETKTEESVEATATEEDVKTETTNDEEASKDQEKPAESDTKA
jgi:small subunit ribosomal protein S16